MNTSFEKDVAIRLKCQMLTAYTTKFMHYEAVKKVYNIEHIRSHTSLHINQ